MSSALLPFIAPLYLGALMLAAVLGFAVAQRKAPGGPWFVTFMAAVFVWTVGYIAELMLVDLDDMLLAARIQYVGIALTPAAWLAFSAEYSGVSWWTRKAEIAVLVVPVITILEAWTNGAHHLLWTHVGVTFFPGFRVLALERGPGFWLLVAFSYVCLLGAAGLYGRAVLVRPPLFRGQAIFLFLAGLAPWVGNILYLSGVSGGLDYTVFGFSVSVALAGLAMLRWRLLSVGPVARDILVEGMEQAVAVLDPECRVVDVNPAMVALLGRGGSREVVGLPMDEALGPYATAPRPGHVARQTVEDVGSERTYDCFTSPIRDHRGRLRGWTLVCHDVTVREEEAEALKRARELAEETARAQRAFITNINHELRTPLNGVLGMLQLLDDSELDPDQREWVGMAAASATSLRSLVERVLALGELEEGDVRLRSEPFFVRAVASDTLESFRAAAERVGTELTLEVGSDLPLRLVGDAEALGKILASLVGNAVKFTRHGRVALRVTGVGDGSDDGCGIRFEVVDTGVGIPAHRLDAIFEGFVQGDPSLTRDHEGAGLGLTIAGKLVAHMGGELRVESEVGHGTRFWFDLELARPAEVAPRA